MAGVIFTGLANSVASGAKDALIKHGASALTDMSATSLVEFTQAAQVEPICAVDTRLTGYDFTTDVMKTLLSRFTAYYLAAGSLLGDVGRIKTVQALDKINPSRSVSYNLANAILLNSGFESIREDLEPVDDMDNHDIIPVLPVYKDVEDWEIDPVISSESQPIAATSTTAPSTSAAHVSNTRGANDLATVSNLSVGVTVNLNISDGHASRDVPVTIRFVSFPTDPRTLTTILKWSEKDNSFRARLRAWRAGELAGWRDLIFMRDVYAERKRVLMNDKTGLFRAMTGRMNKSMISSILSMTPSVGTVSSVAVISEDTLRELEDQIDGKLSQYSVRQNIMNATGLMIIAVVDPITELVTIYTYTRQLPEEYSIKQIKSASKSSGSDIAEIIKMLTPANSGRF